MHILVTADPQTINRIFLYCHQYDIPIHYGQIHHHLVEIAWQIIAEPQGRIDLLLMLFPDNLQVLSQ